MKQEGIVFCSNNVAAALSIVYCLYASMTPPPVQVLTAGGAAKENTTNTSSKKRRPRKKWQQTTPFDDDAAASTESIDLIHLHDEDLPDEQQHLQLKQNPPQNKKQEQLHVTSIPEPCLDDLQQYEDNNCDSKNHNASSSRTDLIWLFLCFLGIMASFVCYGLLLEYTTSGGRHLHELSFLFVTSALYTVTAAAGRYVRDETPTTIPPARFAILGLTSMGSTFCSVRSLRYVIYPIQVLAKSCKPVPVMIMGATMGKKYPLRKYINVCIIVLGVALFMGGGDNKKKSGSDSAEGSASQLFGILLLFISLCFDGGTGAYEDKLMSVHSVQPFDLMYNIQLGKTILAGVGLLVMNQVHVFLAMIQDMGFILVLLGLSGALGQVFIFITISKFGALTCSIIGLARKVTTLVASIYFYGHSLNAIQFSGLVLSVTSMVMNFWGKQKKGHDGPPVPPPEEDEELEKMLPYADAEYNDDEGDVELLPQKESAIV